MKLLGLTIEWIVPYLLKATLNLYAIGSMLNLLLLREFVNSYLLKWWLIFTRPLSYHTEYCAPVLVGLSSGLSNKLELTNQYGIRSLLNMSKSSSYSDLLTFVDLKTLEHRRYSHALTLFYKCIYNMGPINLKEIFMFRNIEYNIRGFNKLHQPTCNSRFMRRSYLYITLRLRDNPPDCVRRSSSLNVFKTKLSNLNLTTGVKCHCNFWI